MKAVLAVLSSPLLAFAFASVRAAEPPMPAEADVAAAVAEAIDGQPVCEWLPWVTFGSAGSAVMASDDAFLRQPRAQDKIDALVKLGFARSSRIEESDGPKLKVELTAAGREHLRSRQPGAWELCYAKRTVERIEVYTPPVERDGYWIVRVVYAWRSSPIEPWSRELFALGALGSDGRAADGERRDWIVLVSTNRGWKDQAWFGNPIK
jgi:DNA-binding PadR family transcriptional regulator